MGTVPDAFHDAVLSRVGAPVNLDNLAACHAWQTAEGGTATFNPFNSTQDAPGATLYNQAGVRNYPSAEVGVAATVATLTNGYYPAVLAALRAGGDPYHTADAVGASPWGTSGALMRAALTAAGVPPGGYTQEVDLTPEQAAQLADVHRWLGQVFKCLSTDEVHLPIPPASLANQIAEVHAATVKPAAGP